MSSREIHRLQPNPLRVTSFKLALIFLCGLSASLLTSARSPILAQASTAQATPNRAEITQILDGSNVFIQNQLAKVNDAANKGQRVRTANARAQLLFNTGAVGRLAPNSVLTVGQCARLQKGALLVNGAMNGCSSSVIAGVRGTTYVMEVAEDGQTTIKVLEGKVEVSKSNLPPETKISDPPAAKPKPSTDIKPSFIHPSRLALQPAAELNSTVGITVSPSESEPAKGKQLDASDAEVIVLAEGEQVNVSPKGVVGAIAKLTQEEFSQLLKGTLFNGFSGQLPGIGKIQDSFQRLFPNVPFPVSVPGLRAPIPRPRIPFF